MAVTALDPAAHPEWETMDYPDLIPAGRLYADVTTNDVDISISFRIQSWLEEEPGGGEQSQIGRNDGILKVMMLLAGLNPRDNVRNLHTDVTTGTTRPDFAALHNGVPLFIAEERKDNDLDGAVNGCNNKFRWLPHYQRLPFFITFAFCFNRCALVVQRRNVGSTRHDYYISNVGQKLAFLKRAITYARVLVHFVQNNLITPTMISMGVWHDRPGGKMIRVNFDGYEVKTTSKKIFSNLRRFYELTRDVQHLERCYEVVVSSKHFFLQPVGSPATPESLHELCSAIRCVVMAIWGVHSVGWLHTDIRWANIIKRTDSNWVVVDCYDACEINSAEAAAIAQVRNVAAPWTTQHDRAQIELLLTQITPVTGNAMNVTPAMDAINAVKNLILHAPQTPAGCNTIVTHLENIRDSFVDFKMVTA